MRGISAFAQISREHLCVGHAREGVGTLDALLCSFAFQFVVTFAMPTFVLLIF